MPISARKKLVLFPPIQTFPTNIVSIAAGGITATSFAPGALTTAAIADGALTAAKFAAGALAGQIVKSIQYGTVTIPDTSGAATATITAVVVAKAALMFLGARGGDTTAGGSSNFSAVTLTNSTTVTANRQNVNGVAIIPFVVVEYP